jgi:hypothetical protein
VLSSSPRRSSRRLSNSRSIRAVSTFKPRLVYKLSILFIDLTIIGEVRLGTYSVVVVVVVVLLVMVMVLLLVVVMVLFGGVVGGGAVLLLLSTVSLLSSLSLLSLVLLLWNMSVVLSIFVALCIDNTPFGHTAAPSIILINKFIQHHASAARRGRK